MKRDFSKKLSAPLSFLGVFLATLAGIAACTEQDSAPPAGTSSTTALSQDLVAAVRAEQQAPDIPIALLGFNMGSKDAPLRVIEFSDFGCGYCRKFHMETWPTLKADFVDTGKVEWKYVPMILGIFPNAIEAAHAGECAGEQDRFEVMSGRLFGDQVDWKNSGEPQEVFRRFAREEGLDVERFDRCVSEEARLERIQAGTALSRQAGVRGTPTFFVVGYPPLQGALPLEMFHQVLSAAWEAETGGGS